MRTATLCTVFLSILNLTQSVVNRMAHHQLDSRRPGVLHVTLIGGLSFLPWETYILKKRFSQRHARNIPALNNTAQWHWDIQGTAWQRDFYEILTRSLRDRDFARQGSRARRQGSFLLFPSILFSSLLYIVSSTLLFSSTVLFSVWVKLLRSHPREFLSQNEYVSKTCVPPQSVRKINATNTWFIQ